AASILPFIFERSSTKEFKLCLHYAPQYGRLQALMLQFPGLFRFPILLLLSRATCGGASLKNEAGPAGRGPAGPASFFSWGWGGMASNRRKIIGRGKSDI
ncbi:MAG TPA: hypothetical protein VHD63_14350, partial [Ktedonobacteraceae bacterium]|nr:hypothetical protein [Ktedonobacteraceae bacterium]